MATDTGNRTRALVQRDRSRADPRSEDVVSKQATGHVRWVSGTAVTRIRLTSTARESFTLPGCTHEESACERSRLLAELAQQFRDAHVGLDQTRKLLGMVAAASMRSLPNMLAIAAELVGGQLRPASAPKVPTFQQIGEQWTSGDLAARYPDQIRTKRSAETDTRA